jgi:hypothetical protein
MPHLIIIRQGSTASGPATVGVLDAQAFCPPYAVLTREDVDLGPGLRMRRAEPGLHAAKSGIGGDPDLFALKPAKTGRLVLARRLSHSGAVPLTCHYGRHPRDTPGRSGPRNSPRTKHKPPEFKQFPS